MEKKLVDIRVTKALYNAMVSGKLDNVFAMSKKKPKPKLKHKDTPYIEVIITGKAPEKRYENAEKIQFPAYCLYNPMCCARLQLGVINTFWVEGVKQHSLFDISRQYCDANRVCVYTDLEELMKVYDVEIVKVKNIVKRDG